jgi:hypothetical protein
MLRIRAAKPKRLQTEVHGSLRAMVITIGENSLPGGGNPPVTYMIAPDAASASFSKLSRLRHVSDERRARAHQNGENVAESIVDTILLPR